MPRRARSGSLTPPGSGRSLPLPGQPGCLAPGYQADFVALDFERPDTTPCYDPLLSLVYSASAANVDSVMVAGRFLLAGGRFQTVDETALLRRAARKAQSLYTQVAGQG
ncbi:MAG: amidohydrolase family protein [Chloroflexi bacterium]|nr:amidohydrolase family protein [Chloroflexota bacterium]